MAKSRTEKVIKNVFFNITMEIIKLICGLVLPKLILSNYGSDYNGIVQSVSQFISCIALMKLGIGGVTVAALFKPLMSKDDEELSRVLASTEHFMRRIGLIFVVFVLVFACIYPIFISTEFDWLFASSLILIISISTFAEYYFGFTYQMLVSADQKNYIISVLSIITIILNTVIAVILINLNCSIHIVKLGSSLVNIISPLYLYYYCHSHYNIRKIPKNEVKPLAQRWDAFAHEAASFINDNTDIMILTVFTNLKEVSVYTVYHYVVVNLKKVLTSFVASFGSAFGDMYARKEFDLMRKNLRVFELIVYSFGTVIYSTALVMLVPFVVIYTKGVEDVEYVRTAFAIIAMVAGIFDIFRYPYKQIINCTGHYKNTRNIAITEACINIIVSLIMVYNFGLVGVAIGTMFTMIFGAIRYSYYVLKHILDSEVKNTYFHMFISLAIMFIVYFISRFYVRDAVSVVVWIIDAFITGIIALILVSLVDYLIYRDDFKFMCDKLLRVFKKKMGK